MVSNIGVALGRNSLVTGFGRHPTHHRHHYGYAPRTRNHRRVGGSGIGRRAIGSVLESISCQWWVI